MHAYEIIAFARLDGVEVSALGDRVHVSGQSAALARWLPQLRAREDQVLHELLNGVCDRCGIRGGPLLAAYWARWQESLCPRCIGFMFAKFDSEGWPELPWEFSSLADLVKGERSVSGRADGAVEPQ